MAEICTLCLLESQKEVQSEKMSLKHLKEKHPYIKTIKSYRELSEHLNNIDFDRVLKNIDKAEEEKKILIFLKQFSKYFNPFVLNILASLIAAYLYSRYKFGEKEYKKTIEHTLKELVESDTDEIKKQIERSIPHFTEEDIIEVGSESCDYFLATMQPIFVKLDEINEEIEKLDFTGGFSVETDKISKIKLLILARNWKQDLYELTGLPKQRRLDYESFMKKRRY